MGRTKRRRNRKICNAEAPEFDETFISLTRWMHRNDWQPLCKLKSRFFSDTGRGFMALKYIRKQDKLVSIPVSLLITTNTVSKSGVSYIFCESKKYYLQQVLSVFLVWERFLGKESFWFYYLQSLPRNFTTPFFCDEKELSCLPNTVQNFVSIQKKLVFETYYDIISSMKYIHSQHGATDQQNKFMSFFSTDMYVWAWFVVNTRSIFIDVCHTSPPIINLKDKNCMALAPYLDILNHSDKAHIKVGLSADGKSLDITTLVPYQKYSQVFINYGPHNNLKLFLEYGFVIPLNNNDSVELSFNDILNGIEKCFSVPYKCYENYKFLKCHTLLSNMFLSGEGLSFNTIAVIYILSSLDHIKNTYHLKVYANLFTDSEKELIYIVAQAVMELKSNYILNILSCINKYKDGTSFSFQVAKQLFCEQIKMVENCKLMKIFLS